MNYWNDAGCQYRLDISIKNTKVVTYLLYILEITV